MEDKSMRVSKYLAHAGIGARRKVEEYIDEGRVTVNGKILTAQGVKIDPEKDIITFDGETIQLGKEHIYIMLHKPSGYLSTTAAHEKRKSVLDLLQKCTHYSGEKVQIVGRLDKESEGLLLLTNDGELANRLMHPRYEKEKKYEVIVKGTVREGSLKSLRNGVEIEVDEEPYITQPCEVSILKEESQKTKLEFILKEGKKRQIRLMCKAVGHPVRYLKRTHIGPLSLGKLPLGTCRVLTEKEVSQLQNL